MSAFGPGGPFGFHSFFGKIQNKTPEYSGKEELSPKGDSLKNEALGNEWLKAGKCPIAKWYRAVSYVLPLTYYAIKVRMYFLCPHRIFASGDNYA